MLTKCGRCDKTIQVNDAEVCWYCHAWLCYECWDEYGHCGHPEADRANERARAVEQPDDSKWQGATSSEAHSGIELRTKPPTKETIMPDVRTIGPFVDTYRLVVDGSRVPYTEIRPCNPQQSEWHITVDGRFGIIVDAERLTEFAWFVANAMAVAAGWTCHGDAAVRINPHNRVVYELSSDNLDFDDEPAAGEKGEE